MLLKHQGLAHQSIISHLLGVRNLAIASGDTPETRDHMPRLQLVRRGWLEPRLTTMDGQPITGAIMHQLVGVWSGEDFESRLMWVVGYFNFLRVGEFTTTVSSPLIF